MGLETNRLYLGDCLEQMRQLPDCSIDAVVTDPPYGLSDHKPEEVVACLTAWLAGQPYHPKGKGFMGKGWDAWVPGPEVWRECLRVLKPGGHMLVFAGTRSMDLMCMAVRLAGFELRDSIGYANDGNGVPLVAWAYGQGFPKSLDVSKAIDKAMGAEREVVGQRQDILTKQAADLKRGSRKIVDSLNAGAPERNNGFKTVSADITASSTEAAKQWEGFGSSLKPAWEPIILTRKFLEGTVAANVLKHGTGALNIDGCRVGTDAVSTHSRGSNGAFPKRPTETTPEESGRIKDQRDGLDVGTQRIGRFPANLIHDGSEQVLAAFPEAPGQQGDLNGTKSAARFFYCAKVSKQDRNAGLPVGQKNSHPTVKPTALMRYLCRLITPPGGIVLDPFMGSGSTGRAAILERFRFVGIEQDAESFATAKGRVLGTVEEMRKKGEKATP